VSRARVEASSVGERGAECLQVAASEAAKPFEIEDPHRHVGCVALRKTKDLLCGTGGDPRRRHNREWTDAPLGDVSCLEQRLGEERHQAIGATFGAHFEAHRVGRPPPP
jgi:hypothetical protein